MVNELPGSAFAHVEEVKVVDYLLNPQHVDGASKARFFSSFGFTATDWPILAKALVSQGQNNSVTKITPTAWGHRYQVDCQCPTPDGRDPCIRTIWQEGTGAANGPRLITAYPRPG